MRNKILENVIEEVVNNSELPNDAKSSFIAYVKNMFDGNAKDDDLKNVLEMIDYEEDKQK